MPNRATERPEAVRNAVRRNSQMSRQLSNLRLNVEKDRTEIQRSFNHNNSKLLARLNALQGLNGIQKRPPYDRSSTRIGQMPPVTEISPRSRTPNPDMLTRSKTSIKKKKEEEGEPEVQLSISSKGKRCNLYRQETKVLAPPTFPTAQPAEDIATTSTDKMEKYNIPSRLRTELNDRKKKPVAASGKFF